MNKPLVNNILLWVLAFVLMVAAAVYQRMTGPNYPVSGTKTVQGVDIKYTLTRSSDGDFEQSTGVQTTDPSVTGRLVFRRYKSDDTLSVKVLTRDGDKLSATLPHQIAAFKYEYYIELDVKGTLVRLPETGTIVARSRDSVPPWAMIPHIIIMFLGMLFAVRGGIEVLKKDSRPYTMALWALILLTIGGLLFGPVVQKYSFGAWWSGWPFGGDLTDNKTIIMVIVWLLAFLANRKIKTETPTGYARWIVLIATVITLAVYLIPHSLLGSELKYDKATQKPVAVNELKIENCGPIILNS